MAPRGSMKTTYVSDPVAIPSDFLTAPASQPPKLTRIDFSSSPLPEYKNCLALVLDNVLTPAECASLLHLAELSAANSGGWRQALVNAGRDVEVLAVDYRNSERIIWDETNVVERIWERCLGAKGLKEAVEEWGPGRKGSEAVLGKSPVRYGEVWRLTRLNERMRFLRYGSGMFFRAHCDGSYVNPHAPRSRPEWPLLTLQLYLNSNNSGVNGNGASPADTDSKPSEQLVGGATSFLSYEDYPERRLDVAAETGRVLIFQHRDLLHEGQEVVSGLKYTMRTDIMYEKVDGRPRG